LATIFTYYNKNQTGNQQPFEWSGGCIFKVNFDDLIQDFENEDKYPSEIGLVIV